MTHNYRVNIKYEGRDYRLELSAEASDKSSRSSLSGKSYSLHMTPQNPELTAQLLAQMQLPTSTSIEGIVRNFTHISHMEDVHLVTTSKTNEVGLSNLTSGALSPSVDHSTITSNQVLTKNVTDISQTKQKLEDFLQTAVEKDHFSGVAMIVHHGEVLLNRGYGMATAVDKNEQNTMTHVGSITKQFTAAAIMKLWEAGTIDLNASINKYLPKEYQSTKWEKVTVHHLLSHTGGVIDYDESYYVSATKSFCFDDAIKAMISECKEKELEFEPGSKWNYSNIGYTLLGVILEKATGLSFGEVIHSPYAGIGVSCNFFNS